MEVADLNSSKFIHPNTHQYIKSNGALTELILNKCTDGVIKSRFYPLKNLC